MFRNCILFLFLAWTSACAVHGSVQTAHTVGKGNFQGAVEPGVIAVAGGGTSGVAPTLNLAGRYGVSDRVDVGGRLGTLSYELTGKFQLSDSEGTVFSLAPSTTFWFLSVGGTGGGFWSLRVPMLIGIPVGESQFIVGPQLYTLVVLGGSDGVSGSAVVFAPGGQVAFSAKLGDSFRLHPELAFQIPVVGAASVSGGGDSSSGVSGGFGGVMLGFNLGLLFGGD